MNGMWVFGLIVFALLVIVYLFGSAGSSEPNEEYYLNLTAALEKHNQEKRKNNETSKS